MLAACICCTRGLSGQPDRPDRGLLSNHGQFRRVTMRAHLREHAREALTEFKAVGFGRTFRLRLCRAD